MGICYSSVRKVIHQATGLGLRLGYMTTRDQVKPVFRTERSPVIGVRPSKGDQVERRQERLINECLLSQEFIEP